MVYAVASSVFFIGIIVGAVFVLAMIFFGNTDRGLQQGMMFYICGFLTILGAIVGGFYATEAKEENPNRADG